MKLEIRIEFRMLRNYIHLISSINDCIKCKGQLS